MQIPGILQPANKQIVHWYDFICPFCYVAQARNHWLSDRGLSVVELPFEIHPEVPEGGMAIGARRGPMYEFLEHEAQEAGLPLRWPSRLPNSRHALSAAEWIRRHEPSNFEQFQRAIFAAHFALGEDIGDSSLIERYATAQSVDMDALRNAISRGEASQAVSDCEDFGKRSGVQGTPAWLIQDQLIEGLQPVMVFERIAHLSADTDVTHTR